MIKKVMKRFHEQNGNAMVLASLAMIALLTMTGLVLDGGKLYMTRAHLQKVANAAALSGAQELTNNEAAVGSVVEKVLIDHQEEASLDELNIQMEDKVRVELKKDVPLTFSKLFGVEQTPVKAEAAAELGVMGRAIGAAPLGIDDSIPLEYFREYKLKVDQTEVDHGYFGVLALGGPGANIYEQNLRHGYQDEINVGDVLETQTGNIAGKTRQVIQDRLNACPLPGDYTHRDCSRVILIPTYTPYNHEPNKQLKEVKVTGFAYFYITEPMHPHDTSITGMFIERTGTGFEEPTAKNKGAFAIRLTE
ncbi:Tad domain-containing protein [Calidifontibacillus oryziterrae]|uniref:Tad domain-containing protein n=1 Tax=Calidifontibacillus oryziterrae TaxID=1191699 RepID=UPI0002EB42AD|nr:Tad domain-containing protein [Calidifontibacillus oryziterrae]